MSELIDRVARAICDATGEFSWEREDESIRSQFRKEAVHAVEAMRGYVCPSVMPVCSKPHAGELISYSKSDQIAANCVNWVDGYCQTCGVQWQGMQVDPGFRCPSFVRS